MKMWQGMLRMTGDELVPHKSQFVPIDFEWKEGKWSYAKNVDVELKMEDHKRVEESLDSLQPSEAKKMLGVYTAADGNNKIQI